MRVLCIDRSFSKMATPRAQTSLHFILLFSFVVANPVLDKVVDSIDKFVQYNFENIEKVELHTLYSLKVVEGKLSDNTRNQ